MDAFFASVEQRDHPELRGKPVIVGGAPRRRGVVSTCSYEARKYGVHSAMPSSMAIRLCPQAIFLEPDFRRYKEASLIIRNEFLKLTPLVEPMSIDEAYLDLTGCAGSLEETAELAGNLQKKIYELTQLTASAGVSFNKFLAKTASDFRKPGGLTLITPENASTFLDGLPVEKFHGIGRIGAEKLHAINVRTGADLRKLSVEILKNLFGKAGVFYYNIVRGVDERPVEPEGDPKSISKEQTLYEDCSDLREIRVLLRILSRQVSSRLRMKGFAGKSVFIKLKYADFRTVTRSNLSNRNIESGEDICKIALKLLARTDAGKRPVRLVGVGVGQLSRAGIPDFEQMEFPDFKGL